jgi:hypothetical protein
MPLFAFDLYCLHDVFGSQLAKLNLRSSVAQSGGGIWRPDLVNRWSVRTWAALG